MPVELLLDVELGRWLLVLLVLLGAELVLLEGQLQI